MQGTYTLDAPVEKVWTFLMDPQAIAKVMPGCETLEEVEPDKYRATMKIGIAAIKGTYNGSVQLLEKTPPTRYRMLIDGSGTAGFVKGAPSAVRCMRPGRAQVCSPCSMTTVPSTTV